MDTNALTELKWIRTNRGAMSPLEVFLSREKALNLEEAVVGYVYGAQYRFLMTIYALLAKDEPAVARSGGIFSEPTVEKVFAKLKPHGELFAEADPFLQIAQADILPEEGPFRGASKLPGKLLPEGQTSEDNQTNFWNLDAKSEYFSIEETALALVCYYFYGVGGNTWITGSKGKQDRPEAEANRPKNGSSALRYLDSIEIIPQGEGLLENLSLSTPEAFTRHNGEELLPHWADRRGLQTSVEDSLWRFSWSSNVAYCQFSEDRTQLVAVGRGGIPYSWKSKLPPSEGEDWPKSYHDSRQSKDPLYFYRQSNGEPKLWRSSLSTDPYYSVAQWHFEKLSEDLRVKLGASLGSQDMLYDFVFLEHATEGSSSSFNIRYSRVLRGWKDELLPEGPLDGLQSAANDVLAMRSKLLGMFTEKGNSNHLRYRRADVETAYWHETQALMEAMVHGDSSGAEIRPLIIAAAIRAFESVSSRRDLSRIQSHMNGLHALRNFRF